MDLTNLRESLDHTADQPGDSLRHAYDEKLNSEFRVAALQLTNLYKRGLENTHDALQSGYALALRDMLDYVRSRGANSSGADLERYLSARLETLHHDADDVANEARATPTPRMRRTARTASHPAVLQTPTRAGRAERLGTKAPASDEAPGEAPASDATPDSATGYVGKLVSSVYNTITPNINPSTLNGAIDVIVVEREVEVEKKVTQEDGTERVEKQKTTELAASPFHVRFGKLSVLRPDERKVTLHLNGSPEPLPFAMKVGENGEAFFVMKIDDAAEGVPQALVTSPIVGPAAESTSPKSPGPEPLDLGVSETAPASPVLAAKPAPAAASVPASGPATAPASDEGAGDSSTDSFPAPFGSGTQDVSALELENGPSGGDEELHASKQVVMNLIDMDGYKVTEHKQQHALAQGQRFANEMPLAKRHGGNGGLGYGERLDRHRPRWKQQLIAQVAHPLSSADLSRDVPLRPGHSRRASDTSLHISSGDGGSSQATERASLPVSVSDSELVPNARYIYETPRGDDGGLGGDGLRDDDGAGMAALPSDEDPLMGKLACAENDPYVFQLQMDSNTLYTFELSLCHLPGFDEADAATRRYLFDEARVSFQRFLEDASIVDDARLCIRHDDSYHTWVSNVDMFTSLAAYRTALLQADEAKKEEEPASKGSMWARLWGSSSAPARKQDKVPAGAIDAGKDTPAPEPLRKAMTDLAVTASATMPDAPTPPAAAAASEALAAPPADLPGEAAPPAAETYVKTLRLTSDQLKQLNLRKGANNLTFSVTSSYSGVATCRARVFLWDRLHPVVVSDIDGTITKSDALGHVFTLMGRDWTHLGVAKLYHDIAKNGYRILYLTSRAIGQAEITRDYLTNINQNDYHLPDGPVIMSPDRLMASLHREVILRKPEVFKMACLRDIARLFGDDPNKPNETRTPFYAGFGNRITDALSYRSVNIPSSRIFTIDADGEVKMELLELAGYKSSYPNMTDLVDQMFPPTRVTHPRDAEAAAYTDFNYWRTSPAEVELPPDEELVPVVQPISPSTRALRSPRSAPRQSSMSLRSPPTQAADTERPSRFSRFALPSLGLSRRKDKGKGDKDKEGAEKAATLASSTPSPELEPRSLESEHGLLPASVLASSPSARSVDGNSVVYDEPNSMRSDADDDEEDDDAEDDDDGDDDDDGRLSPAARRRRRQRGDRASSPSLALFPSLYDRTERRKTLAEEPSAPQTPDAEDDPLLAAGDIQFEWRG
ncbi:phosphatidate phosphatase [Malassezia brasiliensis]|uniref:phosphatidate phosphatase n=1 Tax=Malassezia brasiliensis TaxID=1821822 RepID=A0AAF0DW66_9BASI|nr:phosphatidate phosphatase [Malassezia brasiliensis]